MKLRRAHRDLTSHLSRRGLSNDVLEDLVRMLGISDRFLGVWGAEHLHRAGPGMHLRRRRGSKSGGRRTLIINTGDHWVAASPALDLLARPERGRTPGVAVYVDSYGVPPLLPGVLDFLQSGAKKKIKKSGKRGCIVHNSKQIQSLRSKACGLYAALYALALDDPELAKKMGGIKFATGKGANLAANDRECVRYLKTIALLRSKK